MFAYNIISCFLSFTTGPVHFLDIGTLPQEVSDRAMADVDLTYPIW